MKLPEGKYPLFHVLVRDNTYFSHLKLRESQGIYFPEDAPNPE